MRDETEPRKPVPAEVVQKLVDYQREFLAFLERRVGDRALAEDLLQEAFVRGITKAESLASEDSVRAWFYRVLRNAVIDHARRRTSESQRLNAFAAELEAQTDAEMERAVCKCVSRVAETLKPEYAEAVRKVEVEGMSMREFAEQVGISANNAAVRVFRAREALRKQLERCCGACARHGCLDCHCGHA